MDSSTKKLYDMLPPGEKDQATKLYLYLKYLNHVVYHAIGRVGFPSKEPPEKLAPALDEMIELIVEQLAETSSDIATNIYHGKVVKLKDAIQLVTQEKDLHLEPPEQVIPYKVARNIIIRNTASIAVGECPCRAVSAEPCKPMDVCLFIGDPHASFMIEQHPAKFRKISRKEAVGILEEEHKRGHVHTAYFKKETGNSFYAICNCCSCCCLNVRMWNLLGGTIPSLAPSGYSAAVNDQCTGCAVCVDACPFKAISFNEDEQKAVIDAKKCMGCGVCEDLCVADALKLERNPAKGEPLDIQELNKLPE